MLDRSTAQKLALRQEVQRVQERMTLKHKNTSRWAKKALKQQQKNPNHYGNEVLSPQKVKLFQVMIVFFQKA